MVEEEDLERCSPAWQPRGTPPDEAIIGRLDLYDAEENLNNGKTSSMALVVDVVLL